MNAPSSAQPPLSRREEAKALFRNAILDAAEHVFAERGFHVARIQDVAQHARIGVGTVYNHFEQKEDLLRALLEERTEQMLERLAPLPSDPEPFEEKLTCRLARFLGYIEEHRSFFLVAVDYGMLVKGSASGGAPSGSVQTHKMEKFRAAFLGVIEEGLASGALEPIDAQSLAWALGGILRMFTMGALERRAASLTELAPIITHLFLHGAASRSQSAKAAPASVKRPKKSASRARRQAR